MAGVPKQIKAQGEEAERLWKEQHEKTTPEEETPPAKALVEDKEEVVETPPAEEVVEEIVEEEEAIEEEAPPVEDGFEHKYNVLKGKYDSEIKPLHEELRQLKADLTAQRNHSVELGQIVSDLKAKEIEAPAEDELDASQFLSQSDRDALDESGVDPNILMRLASKVADKRVAAVEAGLGTVETSQAKSAEQVYYDRLDTAVSDWEAINERAGFNDWLKIEAPYTNMTRNQLLSQAHRGLDSKTVIRMFRDYKEEAGIADEPSGDDVPGKTLKKKVVKKPHISPAAGGASPTATKGRNWTPSEVRAFYNDVAKGKYNGKEKEQKAIEKDIWNAQTDGRMKKDKK